MTVDFLKGYILDGAMGTYLMSQKNLPAGYPLEMLNLEDPELVKRVHKAYIKAGAQVISTNTFGANFIKFEHNADEIIKKGIEIARSAGSALIAFDIGSLGKIIGDGGLTFEEAYNEYRKIIKAGEDKADYIVIETMTDLLEAKIAVLAAKENSNLPVAVSMSYEKNGRTFFGNPIGAFALTMKGLKVDAIGINCSLGAKEMLPLAKELLGYTDLPVFIKPNAGLPKFSQGKSFYEETPLEFSLAMKEIKDLGINILGGCCGTTPEHIALLKKTVGEKTVERIPYKEKSVVCSATKVVTTDSFKIVGERINPTGKKRLKQAIIEGDFDYICSLAVSQEKEGADILDVNCGIKDIDEKEVLKILVEKISEVSSLPLMIDTSDPIALDGALRTYTGKAIINSVNASEKSLNEILKIAKKYQAAVIGLTLDENGIPKTSEERINLAEKIINRAKEYKIPKEDIYIDALTLSEASEHGSAVVTLDTLSQLTARGINTVLGISNISFGMPNREDINAKFLELAIGRGLKLAIINPAYKGLQGSPIAERFLRFNEADAYINAFNNVEIKPTKTESQFNLTDAIVTGQREQAKKLTLELLSNNKELDIPTSFIIPALDEIGKLYESGKVFLPQLIASAEAAKEALSSLPKSNDIKSDRRFVIATVKGDIHDIGKNIVKTVVSNYGYKVIDLGRDVEPQKVLQAVSENYPCALGLSALMTTTATNMEETVKLVKSEFPNILVLVGGAVITEDFAKNIGALYCKDAKATVDNLKTNI